MIYQKLTQFELGANYPYVPEHSSAAETGQILSSMIEPIPATVPGCVHNDLLAAGLIPDPYFEMNSLACAWVENYWWTYKTQFSVDPCLQNRHLRLHLAGIDYQARIALNGKGLGEHVGMYTPFQAEITQHINYDCPNTLTVMLLDAPKEMGQIGRTSLTHTQKARFPYKWDFSTRLVQVGLYDTVTLEDFGIAAIEYTHVTAQPENGVGTVVAKSELTAFEEGDATLQYTLRLGQQEVAQHRQTVHLAKGLQEVTGSFTLKNPQLWYPNGWGEQPVYTLTVQVLDEAGLSDEKAYQIGFRTREYIRADGAPEECLPYSVAINGQRLYIKGVNMVPLDIMYGRIQPEQSEHFLTLAKECGINLIRVWGGGLIESEAFYDCCDRLGLMVWQEFIQSSSGIDNVPSKDPEFLKLCKKTAIHAVRTKQHHPCLTFWCGGNELEDENRVPSTFEDANIAMLKEIVDTYDGETFMLPTSATGFHEFLNIETPGKNYDVHGPWKYNGPTQHYTTFNRSDSQLHSEFGVDGMNNLDSISTVLSKENLKVQSMKNPVWRYHGEMWDTFDRDRELFGALPEEALTTYIRSSQYVQAEGLRYAIEANRRRAFQNVGSIIWQFNEPWPNVAGTNLVDYYGQPKMAYYGVKAAFRKAYPNLQYDKLLFEPEEAATLRLFMTSELCEEPWQIEATITTTQGAVLLTHTATVTVGEGRSCQVAELPVTMPKAGGIVVALTARCGERIAKNRYLLLVKEPSGHANREIMLRFIPDFLADISQ